MHLQIPEKESENFLHFRREQVSHVALPRQSFVSSQLPTTVLSYHAYSMILPKTTRAPSAPPSPY